MAEIKEIHGNIFATTCQVLVNTVNCVGVMGAGVALECKYRFPGLFEFYEPFCLARSLEPGKLLLFRDSTPQVLCFPTKNHWKDPAKVSFIEAGLAKFASTYHAKGIASIAFPHLGCSHGSLNWESQVRPLMYHHLEPLQDLSVEIYSFDARAADALFDRLVARIRALKAAQVASTIGVRTQEANRLLATIDSGEVSTMLGLQRCKGIGPTTIEKLYRFLQRTPNEPPPEQLRFDFGE